MVLNKTIAIDLAKYGGEGYVEVGYPPLRKRERFEQLATNLLTIYVDGRPTVQVGKALEAEKYRMLAYVESAPFDLTPDGFYSFTDSLDAKVRGSGEQFYADLREAIEKVKGGDTSPSPSSPAAENVSSE